MRSTSTWLTPNGEKVTGTLVPTLLVRGGGDDASLPVIPNIERVLIHIDAVNTYPVIAAFLMAITVDVGFETPKEIKTFPRDCTKREKAGVLIHNFVTIAYSILSTLTIMAYTYSIIVFTIITIYSKNALGEGHDEAFLAFFNATLTHRIRAFRAFFNGVMGSCLSNTLSRWLRYRGIIRWVETSLMFALSCFTLLQLESIVELATDIIFRSGKR